MGKYQYIARDTSGKRKEGTRDAGNAGDVLSWLREQDLTPISVDSVSKAVKQEIVVKGRRKKIKSADLAALCWQLTTMIEGGIPITTALETISDDVDNINLQIILKKILEKLHTGQTFSEALENFPKVFNPLSIAMIRAGETGGALPATMKRLAEYFDNKDNLNRKIKGAMAYPAFVMIFVIGIAVFIMAFIIPRFKVIFEQFDGELPAFTRGFMGFYDVMRFNAHFIIGGVIFIVIAFSIFNKSQKGHHSVCKFALSSPLFGRLITQGFITTFCRTMSTLVGAGVSVLEVFDILSNMTNNTVIRAAIRDTRERIVEGANLSASLSSTGFFPNLVVKMMQVGEESGSLSRVLERTADYYDRKVDSLVKTMMSLMEPIMIVSVGAIVLVVVFALYLPIFTMK